MPKIASGILCCGPGFFITAAFILSIFANRCNLLRLDSDNDLRTTIDSKWGASLGYNPRAVGTWCYEAQNGNSYEYTSAANSAGGDRLDQAQALGTTATAIGFCLWVFYLFAGCIRCGPTVFKLVGFLAVLNTTFQGLIFLLQQSYFCDGTYGGCGLDRGGRCAIAAAALYFVGGLMSCAAGKEAEAAQEDQKRDIDVVEEANEKEGADEEEAAGGSKKEDQESEASEKGEGEQTA